MNSDCRRLLAVVSLSLLPAVSHAQELVNEGGLLTPPNVPARPAGPAVGEEVRDKVLRGRAQLDNNDSRAVQTLREASQSALVALNQVSGQNALVAAPGSLPSDVVTAGLAQRAGEAHLYWGMAADRFALRDEAITALTRAVRLSRAVPGAPEDSGILRRDSTLELGRVLRDGLPLTAPDDALDAIASIAHGGRWTPHRFTFDPAPLSAVVDGPALAKDEFMVTDGKLFPPVAPTDGALSRIPTYYQGVPENSLPPSLKLDKMVAGFQRETSGSNKGQWRQVARVFYASPYLTKDHRDDLPRARSLCEQFMKVQSLFSDQLGASNLYARGDKIEGVTTLWLLEVSALWPQDDDDPSVLAQLGPNMPNLNVGPKHDATSPEVTALSRPWMPVAGQVESEPGEILFWKSSMVRPESEWVRELFHEYGHVALPPLSGFRPPLEPYANGVMGETLGMLWAAAVPDHFVLATSPTATADGLSADLNAQVTTQALPALQFFRKAGPASELRADGTNDGWRYLQGLTVYLERVYGAQMLGKALAPLSSRAAGVSSVAARRSLMNTQTLLNSVETAWRDPWGGGKTLPLWLPGALDLPLNAKNLTGRGDATLKAGSRAEALLYVPSGTDSLRIDGAGAKNLRAVGLPFSATDGVVRVYFGGRSGWQSFSLTAGADAKIAGARFEKK